MKKTKYFSWRNGPLCKGCKQCVKGAKLVMFVTGLCSQKCFYCPLSERKYRKDVICANEWEIKDEDNVDEILEEAKMCDSLGAGITGGDPLMKLDRTIRYIKALKKKFGKKFHIHLYAPLPLVTDRKLEQLYKAGLDEIRFHPDFTTAGYKTFWNKIKHAKRFKWKVGIEIPIIPGYKEKLIELIEYFKDHVDFFNFNEFEVTGVHAKEIHDMGFHSKDGISYAAKGSEELAKELMKRYPKLKIHYCSAKLKDKVQLANRIKRRAKNAKTKYDKVTPEGMLVRGVIYLEDMKPGFGYHVQLRKIRENKKQYDAFLKDLAQMQKELMRDFKVDTIVDIDKLRLITSTANAKKLSKKIQNCAIVEEYPTKDALEMEIDFL